MNEELKKKLDERLVKGEITPDEYQKILNTIETSKTFTSTNNFKNDVNKATSDNVSNSEFNTLNKKSFWKKLRDGDYGLAKTYWLYGVGVGFIIGILENIIYIMLGRKGIIPVFIIALITSVYYLFFQYPGTWNAANKYTGPKIWAILAKIAIILGIVCIILYVINLWLLFARFI